jgi:hypothetical protein
MDLSLPVTIALIFLFTSLVGYARSRRTDRCLRSFHGFLVTVVRSDGRQVWGRMDLSPGGIEFAFPERAAEGPGVKTSALLYAGEFKLIEAILRYDDRLTDAERRRRDADIEKSFHPGPLRRLARRARNFLGSATDSLREVLSLVVGRVQKTQERFVAAEGTDALTKLGGSVLTEVSSTHDPLLERQIGRHVVLEVIEGDEIHEHVGIFKEYSADFLHLLDVQYPQPRHIDVTPERPGESGRVTAACEGDGLRIANAGVRPVLVLAVETGAGERRVDALVDPEGALTLPLEGQGGRARVRIQAVCDVDMIVPRSRATIRNRAEPVPAAVESAWDFVFDLGLSLRGNSAREERLRRRLEERPDDPEAAAELGGLLLKRQDYADAGRWLRAAYNGRDALPDGGRRVRMQLRELGRRLAQRGHPPADDPSSG